ncbi:hypothetical protein GCK72_009555 [Caenorhabditis remanei]|uniref:C-type lectin domain-containing protein n=1 Tax=Caenorhabditis remanei TaxID=31234 RepID=A0A6A5H2U3_CAERE|nr:hypothetical protein GCK72_009555 [Caenorhabditis remanei]KAF1761299.1 hypothetical protein GCK72_009555 [Caenorhabditis remanei]
MILPFFLLTLPFLVNAQCGVGAIYNEKNNLCYRIYKAAVDFDTAESICLTLNGHLASVHNLDDNIFLTQQASKLIYDNGPVWLGAQTSSPNVRDPNNWKWTDGTPFDYQNYRIGQPSSLGSSACMQFLTSDGTWLTATCTDEFPFICASEPKKITTVSGVTCPANKVNRCPSRYVWFQYTQSCYRVVIAQTSFDSANQYCKNDGAELASVHSYTENEFLSQISTTGLGETYNGYNIWIGLINNNGQWQWTDGSPVDFVNWESNYPQSYSTTAMIPDGDHRWYNSNYAQRGYICKRPAVH